MSLPGGDIIFLFHLTDDCFWNSEWTAIDWLSEFIFSFNAKFIITFDFYFAATYLSNLLYLKTACWLFFQVLGVRR